MARMAHVEVPISPIPVTAFKTGRAKIALKKSKIADGLAVISIAVITALAELTTMK